MLRTRADPPPDFRTNLGPHRPTVLPSLSILASIGGGRPTCSLRHGAVSKFMTSPPREVRGLHARSEFVAWFAN